MDVRRYHAPGTVTRLATRGEDFGFSEYDDFMTIPRRATGDLIFEYVNDNGGPCGLIYNDINDMTVIYYRSISSVPDVVVVDSDNFEIEPVKIAYPVAQINAVYLPGTVNNPRGFYFFNTREGWKLAFVDDSMCEPGA